MAKYCPSCGFSIKLNERTCPSCGINLSIRNGLGAGTPSFCIKCGTAVSANVANCPSCGALINPNAPAKKSSFNLIKLMAIVFGLLLLVIAGSAAIAIPRFKRARAQARQKACFSNIRVLTGAVEMYNMDAKTESDMMNELNINALKRKGYLRYEIVLPEPQCSYSSKGDLTDSGVVYCKYHGELPGYR